MASQFCTGSQRGRWSYTLRRKLDSDKPGMEHDQRKHILSANMTPSTQQRTDDIKSNTQLKPKMSKFGKIFYCFKLSKHIIKTNSMVWFTQFKTLSHVSFRYHSDISAEHPFLEKKKQLRAYLFRTETERSLKQKSKFKRSCQITERATVTKMIFEIYVHRSRLHS